MNMLMVSFSKIVRERFYGADFMEKVGLNAMG